MKRESLYFAEEFVVCEAREHKSLSEKVQLMTSFATDSRFQRSKETKTES